VETKIVYFEKPGEENTDEVLALAKRRARELGIKAIVVASTSGNTAVKAVDVFKGLKVVVVTHAFGARGANALEVTDENRKTIESKGGRILTTTHGFGGINQALQSGMMPPPPGGSPPPGGGPPPGGPPPRGNTIGEIVASTLGIFSRGMKVACEITIMAADAGLVRTDEEVIAIGGTHSGADTAIVVQPSNAHRFFELKVKEIICKPRL
jgi:hypothetical protein